MNPAPDATSKRTTQAHAHKREKCPRYLLYSYTRGRSKKQHYKPQVFTGRVNSKGGCASGCIALLAFGRAREHASWTCSGSEGASAPRSVRGTWPAREACNSWRRFRGGSRASVSRARQR